MSEKKSTALIDRLLENKKKIDQAKIPCRHYMQLYLGAGRCRICDSQQ